MPAVLFGTVEYYERVLLTYFPGCTFSDMIGKDAKLTMISLMIISMLENEIMHALLVDEAKRIQCFQNFMKAFCTIVKKVYVPA